MRKAEQTDTARYARMLSGIGTEPRLRIMRLLLSAPQHGMIVTDIQAKLGIPGSTLSHHLEKLRHAGPGEGSEAALLSLVLCEHRNSRGVARIST